jgi:hypothetical protein
MNTILYTVEPNKLNDELEFLHNQSVYPSTKEYYDWGSNKVVCAIACIIDDDVLLTLKLRLPDIRVRPYVQR